MKLWQRLRHKIDGDVVIEGERGIPQLNQRRPISFAGIAVFITLLVSVCGVLYFMPSGAPAQKAAASSDPNATKNQPFVDPPAANGGQVVPPIPAEQDKPPAPPIVPPIDPKKAPHDATPAKGVPLTPLEQRMKSQRLGNSGPTTVAATPAAPPRNEHLASVTDQIKAAREALSGGNGGTPSASSLRSAPQAAPGDGGGSEAGGMGALLKTTALEGTKASLVVDPDLMMLRGKKIRCNMENAVSSVTPGMVICTTSEDVTCQTGNVVCLDRGTVITGETKGTLTRGQNRLPVLAARAETPRHVVIPIDSLVTDELGRPGMPGYIDHHIPERFGPALFLSLLTDAATIAAAAQSGGGNTTVVLPSTGQTGKDLATTALQDSIKIPDSLEQLPAVEMMIVLARDLDFRTVYSYRKPPR